VADKPVSAEEVIEAARGFLKATLNNAFDFDDKRLYDEHAERLEDLLTQYDAQPKPRWLKPEEVTVEGWYWLFDYGVVSCVVHLTRYVTGRFWIFARGAYLVDCPEYLFYGPLPEPPPPEEK
jgi:hypothetical protein